MVIAAQPGCGVPAQVVRLSMKIPTASLLALVFFNQNESGNYYKPTHCLPVGMPSSFEPLPKPFTTFPTAKKGSPLTVIAQFVLSNVILME